MEKILFVCGSLDLGRDGVGDYTRELAGALRSIGVESEIIAIMDRDATGILKESQFTRGQEIFVTRLSKFLSFSKRKKEYQKLVADFNPDFISLQYVPYAFSQKGVPFNLISFLRLKDIRVKWHFMFHESYIGGVLNFKNKIIQKIQIFTLRSLVEKINPSVIHTSTSLYQAYLNDIGIKSDLLGLFGNIPIAYHNAKLNSSQVFRGVYFGAAPQVDVFEVFVNGFKEYILKSQEKIELVLCGKSGAKGKAFANFLRHHIPLSQFHIIEKGNMSSEDLSVLFLNSDFAVAREPPHLLGKSGSAIAMLEHGLHMWVPLAKDLDQIAFDFDFRSNQCFVDLSELRTSKQIFERKSRLEEIVTAFTESLIDNDNP